MQSKGSTIDRKLLVCSKWLPQENTLLVAVLYQLTVDR